MGAIKTAIMAPRGHSKTVSWTIGPSLWRAWKEKGKTIILSSASRTQSKDILDKIKRVIVRNEALQHLKPSPENMALLGDHADIGQDEKEWAATSVTTTTDVSIKTKTFGSSIRGKHVDYVFLDDVLQDEGGTRGREQEKENFHSVIAPIVENKGGLLQMVGTPMSHDDLLKELLSKDSFYGKEFQAYDPDEETVLWPDKWDMESLKQKKAEVGPARFAREYQCRPMSVDEQYFPVAECIEPNISHEHYKPKVSDEKYNDWEFVLGVDVALSDTEGSDYNVFTVIGNPGEGDKRYVVDIVRKQTMSPEEIADTIETLDNRYQFREGFYEKNAQGEGLWHEMQGRPDFKNRIQEFNTTRKTRPQVLSSLQAALYRKELQIPDKENLTEELGAFRKNSKGKLEGKGHDDTVMSLAIAYECLEGEAGGQVSIGVVGDETFDEEGSLADTGVVSAADIGENDGGSGEDSIEIGIV